MVSCPKCGKEFAGNTVGAHTRGKCGVTSEELFWAKVDRTLGPASCWEWKASRNIWNYGHFVNYTLGKARKENPNFLAHRLAYEFTHGPIPAGMVVMHTCDNPPCCNPAHMRLGTHSTNHADMRAKGRIARGEAYPHAKINNKAARRILSLRPTGRGEGGLAKRLALEYGVNVGTINSIWRGATWSHVR